MSEEWRRIAEFRRPVSRLQLSVTADAEIEIREGRHVIHSFRWRANDTLVLDNAMIYPRLPSSFSVFLKSDHPNCQCQIQAEYTEEVTDVIRDGAIYNVPIVDMRLLYGPMGLGIPMGLSVSGNLLDYQIRAPRPYDIVRERYRRNLREEVKAEPKEEKGSPGITRLQAFMRELEEEKPKKKEVRKKKWSRKPSL